MMIEAENLIKFATANSNMNKYGKIGIVSR